MEFFPFEDFYIITDLKPDEVQTRLEKEVEPDKGLSFSNLFSRSSGTFTGYVVNGKFEFKRIINYQNSFLPQIKGSTEPWMNGSRVHIKMTLHMAVLIFVSIWLGLVFLFGIGFSIQELRKGPFKFIELIPLAMFAFGYLLTTGGFKFESIKARNMLIELLNGSMEK